MTIPTTCYACDEPATTKEHTPPFSFFPAGHRENLITVPSCALHNNANSLDVEYARNVISTMFSSNDVGQQHFGDKGMRSFARSPKLLNMTFADIRAVNIHGMTTGAFTVDIQRIKAVMNACVRALHFHRTGQRKSAWQIVLPNLVHNDNAGDEAAIAWQGFLSMLGQIPFRQETTNSPEVFKYAMGDLAGGLIYSMQFYSGFSVIAVTPA